MNGVYAQPNPADPMIGRDDRSKESTLGDLVADSLVASLSSPERGGATIGVVNPGGLRNELFYAPDGGVVTYAEAEWGPAVRQQPLDGDPVRRAVQDVARAAVADQCRRQHPDPAVPATGPVRQRHLHLRRVKGRGDHDHLDHRRRCAPRPAASYRIGTFSFLASGGDNFRVFTDGTDARDSGLIDRDAWIQYLRQNPHLTPDFARRSVAVVNTTAAEVKGGESITLAVSKLDLTSLGSPVNASLRAEFTDAAGTVTSLARYR